MKHPWAYYLKLYLDFIRGHYAEDTIDGKRKRLTQLKKIVYELHEDGLISTVSPRHLTAKDIAALVGYRKSRVEIVTVQKDISALEGFLKFCGCDAIKKFRDEYPRFIPTRHHQRLPSLSYEEMFRIMKCANEVDTNDVLRMRSFAVVMLGLCGGLRNGELRLAKFSNIGYTENGIELAITEMKDKGTYGYNRHAPLLLIAKEFFERYFISRRILLEEQGIESDALIPSLIDGVEFTSGKNLRKLKDHAERDIGFEFDLRILRRTYGQYLVDSGVPLEVVQVAMGHNSPNTTFKNYAGVRPERVPDLVFKRLIENQREERKTAKP